MEDLTTLYIKKNEYENMYRKIIGIYSELQNCNNLFDGVASNLKTNYAIDDYSSSSDNINSASEKLGLSIASLQNNIIPSIKQKIVELKEKIRIEEERMISS